MVMTHNELIGAAMTEVNRLQSINNDLVSLLTEASSFIESEYRGSNDKDLTGTDLIARMDAALLKAKGE